MTLRAFFDYLGENPFVLLAYFIAIPLLALLVGFLGRGEGHESPWKYLYALLIYAVCIPGIFAVALSVYFFLFERGSILDANVLLQILPVISMILTLALIRSNTTFDAVPGFGKISNLMLMIGAVIVLMYFVDRVHLIAFVSVPVQYLVLIVVGLLLAFRFGLKSLIAR